MAETRRSPLTTCVLDASAVLAFMRNEAGADEVAGARSEATISAVNLCEVVGVLTRDGFTASQVDQLLAGLDVNVEPFDEVQAIEAGKLIAVAASAGLSLGDRACLALARSLSVPALTADRPWARLPEISGLDIRFIR